ncbi:MAG: PqqD family protein [Gemmatimonadaceae bacterium]
MRPSENQVSCSLQGEAVILNYRSGVYYGLNPVGARIWELIQESRTAPEVHQDILSEYEVDSDRCWNDLQRILAELQQAGLIDLER